MRQLIILAGNISARVGRMLNDEVVGEYGEVLRNSLGEMQIKFCMQHNLVRPSVTKKSKKQKGEKTNKSSVNVEAERYK